MAGRARTIGLPRNSPEEASRRPPLREIDSVLKLSLEPTRFAGYLRLFVVNLCALVGLVEERKKTPPVLVSFFLRTVTKRTLKHTRRGAGPYSFWGAANICNSRSLVINNY